VQDRRFVDLLWRLLKAGHIERGLFMASSEGVTSVVNSGRHELQPHAAGC